MRSELWIGIALFGTLGAIAPHASADFITIGATRDAAIYEDQDGFAANGAGRHLFAGRTQQGLLRRSLIRFEFDGLLPEGAVITSVTLALHATQGQGGLRTISLHRALAPWSTGSSNPPESEGQGAPATAGDCTWIHSTTNGVGLGGALWANAGGDFAANASASASTTTSGLQTWTGDGLIADVQAFLDDPSANFGWFIVGDELEANQATTRRFDSADSIAEGGTPPALTIGFLTIPAPAAMGVFACAGVLGTRRRRDQV
ncbi:MAG: hypothetical protein RI967_1587 [Planctomycetota bacterium]|jgi:hypothetical protein